jgi:acetyltransferase-like isoleucine patch superfamily enzyme
LGTDQKNTRLNIGYILDIYTYMNNCKKNIESLINHFLDFCLRDYIQKKILNQYLVFGDCSRLKIADTAVVNNALFNLSSGEITLEDYVFFGHNVTILTGTHDYEKFDRERQLSFPTYGRNVIIRRGTWIASNAIVLAPCIIGKHSVIAAGSLVNEDVPPYTLVAGVPAKIIKKIDNPNISEVINNDLFN